MRSTGMNDSPNNEPREEIAKKPYLKPGFRFEQIFEVSALNCGKVSDTQDLCHMVPKAS